MNISKPKTPSRILLFPGSQILDPHLYEKVVWQRRVMALATFLAILGFGLFLFTAFSPSWAIIDFVNTRHEHVHVVLGVWGEWRSTNASRHGGG
jgi:hypothetical protein